MNRSPSYLRLLRISPSMQSLDNNHQISNVKESINLQKRTPNVTAFGKAKHSLSPISLAQNDNKLKFNIPPLNIKQMGQT